MHPGTGQGLRGRRVLVVEDEFYIADDVAQALGQLGAVVVGPVPTPDRALEALAAGLPDFAVLDINLEGGMAFPVADALLAQGVPFLFASGYTRASVPPRFQHVPLWEKPFEIAALLRALSALTAR